MTNKDILRIAMKQSAEDIGCKADYCYRLIVPSAHKKSSRPF